MDRPVSPKEKRIIGKLMKIDKLKRAGSELNFESKRV
jgi:hypothetical protein